MAKKKTKTKKKTKRRKTVGGVKDSMKTSKKSSKKDNKVVDLTKKDDDGIFGRLRRKKKKPEETAKTFADSIVEADDMLQGLIAKKRAELDTEKGEEDYNRKALAHLTSMEFHLEQVCNHASDYGDLRK